MAKYVAVASQYRGKSIGIPGFAKALQLHDAVAAKYGGTCEVHPGGDLVTTFPANGNRSKLEKAILSYVGHLPKRFSVTKVEYKGKGRSGMQMYADKQTVTNLIDLLYKP